MKAVSCEKVRNVLLEACSRFGWQDYLYTFSRNRFLTARKASPFVCEASPASAVFFAAFFRQRLYTEDPRHPVIQNCDLPQYFVFDTIRSTQSSRENRFFQLIEDARWKSGLTIPVHGYGGAMGITSLYSRERELPAGVVEDTIAFLSPHLLGFNAWSREVLQRGDIHDQLTQREMECVRLVAKGRSSREIAALLAITKRTVDFHVTNAMQKLGASSRSEAASLISRLLTTRDFGAPAPSAPKVHGRNPVQAP